MSHTLPDMSDGAEDGVPPGAGRAARALSLQRLVESRVRRGRAAHAVLGVRSGDGSFSWIGAAGRARPGGDAMRPDTPYFIASVTKLFIATIVLQLHELGAVDLDDALTAHLPADLVAGIHRMGGVDHTPDITLRHLLAHTSGLPDYLEDHPRGERSWYARIVDGEDRSWNLDDAVRRARDDLTPRFAPRDPRDPRARGRYSDTGFQLLIAVIEAAEGRPFHEVLRGRILDPLGMRHTYLPGRGEPPAGDGEPAAIHRGRRPFATPMALESTNDLVSTAGDTLVFMRALSRGELFEHPATYGLMHAGARPLGVGMPRYGLGMMVFRIPRLFGPGRRAATLLGHSGSTGSWLFHCPEADLLLSGTFDQTKGRGAPFRLAAKALRICAR